VEDIQKENLVLYTTGIKLNHVSVKYVTSLKIMLTPPDAIILAISRDACLVFFYNLFRICITSQNGLNPYIYLMYMFYFIFISLLHIFCVVNAQYTYESRLWRRIPIDRTKERVVNFIKDRQLTNCFEYIENADKLLLKCWVENKLVDVDISIITTDKKKSLYI
jgi:hypothetical protein